MKLVKEYGWKKVRNEERKKIGRGMLRQKRSRQQKERRKRHEKDRESEIERLKIEKGMANLDVSRLLSR
jgi:hypothetical protein